MKHGKNVRSPQLLAGSRYAMKTWGKTPTYNEVLFVHFLRAGNQTFKQPNVQLKDMLPTDFYVFKLTDGAELRGKMKDLCLVRADSEARITFAELLQQSTAMPAAPATPVEAVAEETVAEEPVVEETVTEEPVAAEAVETVAEMPEESSVADVNEELLLGEESVEDAEDAETDTVESAAPEGESKEDRKRRLDRERKAEKRRLAKASLTALVSAPTEDGVQAAA